MNTLTKVTKETKDLVGRWTAKSLMPFVLLYDTANSEPDEGATVIFIFNDEWFKGVYTKRLGFYSQSDCTGFYPTKEKVIYYFYAGGEDEN